MNMLAFRLRPESAWATDWHADTLFGALCWEMVRRGGEAPLIGMLERFRKGDAPFVLSDALPGNLLPAPRNLGIEGLLRREDFLAARKGEKVSPEIQAAPFRNVTHWRWSRADEGAFEHHETVWSDSIPAAERFLTIYARVTPEWREMFLKLLESAGRTGIGARRSLGRGRFQVEEPETCPWLEPLPFENGFVSLSHFVPHETDPARGNWSLVVDYPKLEGSLRASKGRLIQLSAGSCFQLPSRPKRWYGRMVAGFPGGAVHYGLSLAVGMKWS